ncbi:MAG: hypothetical protein QM793_03050 [Muricomes sp.]
MSDHTLFTNNEGTIEKPEESIAPEERANVSEESSPVSEEHAAASKPASSVFEDTPVTPREKSETCKPAPEDDYSFFEEDNSSKSPFHFKKKDRDFSRDAWILSHIDNTQLMEYLRLEQRRNEFLQNVKETREKRIFKAFELTISLAAVVAVIFLLKDNPSILINILYIAGIIAAFWLWKNPREK